VQLDLIKQTRLSIKKSPWWIERPFHRQAAKLHMRSEKLSGKSGFLNPKEVVAANSVSGSPATVS